MLFIKNLTQRVNLRPAVIPAFPFGLALDSSSRQRANEAVTWWWTSKEAIRRVCTEPKLFDISPRQDQVTPRGLHGWQRTGINLVQWCKGDAVSCTAPLIFGWSNTTSKNWAVQKRHYWKSEQVECLGCLAVNSNSSKFEIKLVKIFGQLRLT